MFPKKKKISILYHVLAIHVLFMLEFIYLFILSEFMLEFWLVMIEQINMYCIVEFIVLFFLFWFVVIELTQDCTFNYII